MKIQYPADSDGNFFTEHMLTELAPLINKLKELGCEIYPMQTAPVVQLSELRALDEGEEDRKIACVSRTYCGDSNDYEYHAEFLAQHNRGISFYKMGMYEVPEIGDPIYGMDSELNKEIIGIVTEDVQNYWNERRYIRFFEDPK